MKILAYTFRHPSGDTWETVALLRTTDPREQSLLTNRLCTRLRRQGYRLASVHSVTEAQADAMLNRFAQEDANGGTTIIELQK